MDANEMAEIVAGTLRAKFWYYDYDKREDIVSEGGKLLASSLRNRPEWRPKTHVNNAVRSAAKEYYRGPGRDIGQTTREARKREPGRRSYEVVDA